MAGVNAYPGFTNVPHERRVTYKFTVDGSNAPALVASPVNLNISSVTRVSQGLFRLTLLGTYRNHVATIGHLNVNAAGQQRFFQPGPVANAGTSTPVTVDILVVDNAGAVQDPAAANANNFIAGEIIFCDTNAV